MDISPQKSSALPTYSHQSRLFVAMLSGDPGPGLRALAKNIPSIEARHLFEISGVITAAKRVVRVVVDPTDIAVARSLLLDLGLEVQEAPLFLGIGKATSLGDKWTIHVQRDDPRSAYAVIFAAREAGVATIAANQEGTADAEEIGRLLGYPDCCLRNYYRIEDGAEWLTLLLEDHRARGRHCERPSYLTNKIGYLFDGVSLLPDYFPCSLHCRNARNIAANLRSAAMECGLADLVSEAEHALRRPIVAWCGLIIQPLDCVETAIGQWAFTGESALRFDWHPPTGFSHSLLDQVGGCQSTSDGLSLLDRRGRPIAGTCDAVGQIILFD